MTHASSPHQDHSNHANRVQHTGPLKDGNYRMSCQAHVNHYLTSVSNPTTGQNATGVKWCNVLWKLRYNTSDCSYTIFHRDSTNTLDLLESRRESGTNIIVYPSTGNPNQKWKFSETSTGSFVLTSVCSPHLEMAMAGSGACQDITVHARTANPTAAEHQWIFILS